MHFSPSAFLRLRDIAGIGDEMFQRAQKKRTESAFLTIGSSITAIPNEHDKKPLRQILRVFRADALAPQEKIKGPPINAAQIRERLPGRIGRLLRIASSDHHRPASRDELSIKRFGNMGSLRHAAFLPAARKRTRN